MEESHQYATSSLQAAALAALAAQHRDATSKLDASISDLKSSFTEAKLSPSNAEGQAQGVISISRSASDGNHHGRQSNAAVDHNEKISLHPERHMWSQAETKALVDGCNKYGIGNWKAILNDEDFSQKFEHRTPGDLKDRFRTYFPDAYHELYPNAKTHTSKAVRSKAADGTSIFEKGKTKERRPFSPAEDEVLKKGYEQHGSHWATIAKEAIFEGKRKSTDLRDRFRNAFPGLYEQAGYKPRIKSSKKERRTSSGAGSFSHPERVTVLQTDWQNESIERPGLQSRSETSTSAHSQTVSEHSEMSEEDDDESDAISHSKVFDASFSPSANAQRTTEGKQIFTDGIIAASTLPANRRRGSEAHLEGHHRQSSHSHGHLKPTQPLRRTQSTKRASKIGNLDQAVKEAFSKSSKEALLASHQQHQHHHHHHQLHPQQPQTEAPTSKRPSFGQSFSAGWMPRTSWSAAQAASAESAMTSMDLDAMDEAIGSEATSQLRQSSDTCNTGASTTSKAQNPSQIASIPNVGMTLQQQVDFASMYNQLLASSNGQTNSSRPIAVESFQDLLDPMLPFANSNLANWDQLAGNTTWTPISSAAAISSLPANGLSTSTNASATRRDYEHNQWAGDLLHRGNSIFGGADQQDFQGFVSMASMHLTPTTNTSMPLPSTRSAEDQCKQGSTFNRQQGTVSTLEQGLQRPSTMQPLNEATPSVNDLLSRSSRRQSFPLRPIGSGMDTDEAMQGVYHNSFSYPADDISLLNSSSGGSMTLFPSLVGTSQFQGVNDYSSGGGMRRRRSTDTLREGAYAFPQSWRGGLMEGSTQQITEQQGGDESRPSEVISHHGTSEQSLSISDRQKDDEGNMNDDDDDAPSRAASVDNLGISNSRDNGLYAESLPDLSTGIGGERASTGGSDSVFSSHHNLQISYDDMDMPSFLNRSPNLLHATPAITSSSNKLGQELRNSSFKSWPFNLVSSESARIQENTMMNNGGDRVEGLSLRIAVGSNSIDFSSSFTSNPIKDAGALDRLEHLYLEGLHTSTSPYTNLMQNSTGSNSAFVYGSNGATSSADTSQGQPTISNNWWPPSSSSERGVNNSSNNAMMDGSGYESV